MMSKKTPVILTQDNPQIDQISVVSENTEVDRVGNWTDKDLCVMHEIDTEYKRPEIAPLPSRPQDFIPHGKVQVLPFEDVAITRADGSKTYALARVNMQDGSVIMSQQNKDAIRSTSSPESYKYLSGDVTAQLAIFFHEVNHSKDQIYLHTNAKYNTPVNETGVDVTLKNLMLQSQNVQQEKQAQTKTTNKETLMAQTLGKTPQKTLSFFDAVTMINGGR